MMLNLMAGYHQAGHEAHIVIPRFPKGWPYATPARVHALPSMAIPGSGGYRLVLSPAHIRAVLDRVRPDVIELSDRLTMAVAAEWAREHDVPVSFFAHERLDGVLAHHAAMAPARRLADSLNRHMASRVDSVITTTKFAAGEFDRLGIPTQHIPLGVEAHTFVPRLHAPAQSDGVRLVMCSRLSREKSPGTAVDVVREAVRRGHRWHLEIIGDGPLRGRLTRQARGLPISFTGFVRDRTTLAARLRAADVFLAPGPIETFGLAALESLACGTPVVCREDSALPEVVGTAGLAVDADPRRWVDAVEALATPPQGAVRQRARERALQLPWASVVSRLLAHHGLEQPAHAPSANEHEAMPLRTALEAA